MFTTITTATTTNKRTMSPLRALALAGALAITASACSAGAATTEANKAISTTITADAGPDSAEIADVADRIASSGRNDSNNSDSNNNDSNSNDSNSSDSNNSDSDSSNSDSNEAPTPAPRPVPAPQPTPDPPAPAFAVGACDSIDLPASTLTYSLFADAETRTEPVIGAVIEVLGAGQVVDPFLALDDCAVGDDGTVWWFVASESNVQAWINAGWLDGFDLNEGLDYTAADLYFVAIDCFEQAIEPACDELFSRNDGTASQIGSSFVAAYMAGDLATLEALSVAEYGGGFWWDVAATEDIAGDGFGAESLSISGNTFSFVPFPTGGITCYADAGVVASCTFSE